MGDWRAHKRECFSVLRKAHSKPDPNILVALSVAGFVVGGRAFMMYLVIRGFGR